MLEQARFWIGLALAVAFVVALVDSASSRDLEGKYANSPNSEWVKSRHNKQGTSCCEVADGHRLDDVDWKSDGDTYSVRIEGQWVKIPPDHVLTEPNVIGPAMVWIWNGVPLCFIPGAGG